MNRGTVNRTAVASETKRGFFIAVGCPGCGGELELQEDFFVLRCSHCSSTLRIRMPEQAVDAVTGQVQYQPAAYVVKGRKTQHEVRFAVDRYLKERGEPLTGHEIHYKRIYYPYWKIDAILLKTRNRTEIIEQVNEDGTSSYEKQREERRTEVTLAPYTVTFPAGNRFEGMPHTVGMRASYVKAEPYGAAKVQEGYSALPVVTDWAEAREMALKTVGNVGSIETPDFGKNRTEMFRPKGSIVYFPYWVAECYGAGNYRRWVVDAVTGQVAGHADRMDEGNYEEEEAIQFGRLEIGFHRCGNCGHDLPGEQSYVYVCEHCGELTIVEQHALFGREVRVVERKGRKGDVYLPFWAITLTPEMAARLKVLAGGMGQTGMLVAPAIRASNLEASYRLGRRMTAAVGQMTLTPLEEPEGKFAAVGIGPSEAVVLARVMVARELIGQGVTAELPQMAEAFTSMGLFFVPFHEDHYFYVDSVVNAVAVEKMVVDGSGRSADRRAGQGHED